MSNICSKCNKRFSTASNLKMHLKTVCSDNIQIIECEYCNQKFKRNSHLLSHYTICKSKLKNDLDDKEQRYIQEIQSLKEKCLFIEIENKRLTDLIDALTSKISDINTTNNTNSNNNTYININANIYENLNPITDETFFQYGQEITQKVLFQGLEGVLNLGMKHFKDKVVCTDKSRNTLKYKMKDQIINDKGGVRLAEQIINQSIEPKVKLYDKTLVDVYKKKSTDPTVLKYEQAQLNSMIELRNAIIDNDDSLKTKIGSKMSKRALTNHAMIADLNGATTKNMWEFFNQSDKSCERILFNSVEYFLVRDANKNVIRALEVDEDGLPILDTEIDFSEQAKKLLPPPTVRDPEYIQTKQKKSKGRPKKVKTPEEFYSI